MISSIYEIRINARLTWFLPSCIGGPGDSRRIDQPDIVAAAVRERSNAKRAKGVRTTFTCTWGARRTRRAISSRVIGTGIVSRQPFVKTCFKKYISSLSRPVLRGLNCGTGSLSTEKYLYQVI